jgi:predicted RNA-binding protein (virulence factor B family)
MFHIVFEVFLYIYRNLDHLGYLAMQNKTTEPSSNTSACSQNTYKNEAVELTVTKKSCSGCFEFADGQASICLMQQENLKEVVF